MSLETYGWLVLLLPLAGALVIAFTSRCCRGGRTAGSARWRSRCRSSPRSAPTSAAGPRRGGARGGLGGVGLRRHRGPRRPDVDPHRPAVGADDRGRLGRLGADPPLLGRLHALGPGLHAVLRLPELLRVLDAAAGPRGELPRADHRLGVRRRGVLSADLVLVPADDRHAGRDQGLRHQRRRRHRPHPRDVLHLRRHRKRRLPDGRSSARPRSSAPTTATSSPAACCCWSAPSRSRRRCRCTRGSPTPWRARPPSRR